jgi:hypothetical protein
MAPELRTLQAPPAFSLHGKRLSLKTLTNPDIHPALSIQVAIHLFFDI